MGSHGVDLVYEMQGELNWDKDFASLACKEYSRWLQLRAKTGDFQFCKLPPSRVVAMVWNLHRQWTFDYEKTCAALGGFIHHFPPAMRLSFSREQGYAVTLQTYKSHFREDPPASYWEPPICPSRSDVGPPGLLTQNVGRSESVETHDAALTHANAARESDEYRVPNTDVGIPKSGIFPRLKRKSTSNTQRAASILARQQVVHEESNQVTPTEPNIVDRLGDPHSMAEGTSPKNAIAIQAHEERRLERRHEDTTEEAKVSKTPRGGKKVREDFVLRPLAPGEKRKRGRPSMSDYVPVSQLTTATAIKEKSIQLADTNNGEQNVPVGSSPTRAKPASVTIGKRRKGRSLKTRTHLRSQTRSLSQTADDSILEYSGSTNLKLRAPCRSLGTMSARRSDATGRKNIEASAKQQLSASVRIGPDGRILRRPPGRPRKDGSWPVPRVARQQASQPSRRRKSNAGLLSRSQTTKDASGKPEGGLPTVLVTDADLEDGDATIRDLEGRVSQPIIDAADADAIAIQL